MKRFLFVSTILLSLSIFISCSFEPEINYCAYRDGWYEYNDGINKGVYIYYYDSDLICAGNEETIYTDNLIEIMKESHTIKNVLGKIRYIEDQYYGIPVWALNYYNSKIL